MLTLLLEVRRSAGRSCGSLVFLCLAMHYGTALSHAQPLTFAYEGVIDSATGGAEFTDLIGEVLFFQFTFDPDVMDTNSDPIVSEFPAIDSIQACVGPGGNVVRYHEDSGNVTLTDSVPPPDSAAVIDGSITPGQGTMLAGLEITAVEMRLGIPTTPFITSVLPRVQPDPANFSGNELFVEWGGGAGRISATDLRITDPVPEPSAAVITAVASAMCCLSRRRKLCR